MKRMALTLVFLLSAFCFLLSAPTARAQVSVFGGLTAFTNITTGGFSNLNSSVIQTNTASVNVGRFYITYGGIGAGTNHLFGLRQFSLDGTNFFTINPTWKPKTTNGATETVESEILSFPIYMRMSASTDTNISIGAIYLSPN